jgi:hypothetical protein
MSSHTEAATKRLRRHQLEAPMFFTRQPTLSSECVTRVRAAAEADAEREAARTATLIALGRRRLGTTPIPERAAHEETDQ